MCIVIKGHFFVLLRHFMSDSFQEFLVTIDDIVPHNQLLKDLLCLFDLIPGAHFHVKDKQGRFLWMNKTLKTLLGIKSDEKYVGKTDVDYFTPDLVFLYHREDNEVISTRRPILNQPWIVPSRSGVVKWFISSKIPLFDIDQNIFGTAGIMRNLSHEFESTFPAMEMKAAVDYIFEHYKERIDIEELSSLAFLSRRQFERRFRETFQLSPGNFILKIRIDTAIRLLIESDLSITQIAQEAGFYDNSYLTRQFKKSIGISPLQFRKKYSTSADNYVSKK